MDIDTETSSLKMTRDSAEIHRRTAMLHRGVTVSAVARRLRLSHSFVSMVVSGKRRSRRVENSIASLVGIARGRLWTA